MLTNILAIIFSLELSCETYFNVPRLTFIYLIEEEPTIPMNIMISDQVLTIYKLQPKLRWKIKITWNILLPLQSADSPVGINFPSDEQT